MSDMNGARLALTRARGLAMGVLLAAVGCTAAAQPNAPGHGAHPPHGAAPVAAAAAPASRFQREMDAGMAKMMQDMHAVPASGQVDADFLAMMIPHHAGAVDMARLVLQHGQDPVTRQLAEDIIAGQTTEIESMTRRLQALRAQRGAAIAPEFPTLGGTRGP